MRDVASPVRAPASRAFASAAGAAEPAVATGGGASAAAAMPNVDLDDLIISQATVRRMQELRKRTGQDLKLRVRVENGGCSGFQYVFDVTEEDVAPDDTVFSREGVSVLVDELSLDFVRGATVDFVEELIRAAFVIANNPNAESGCGCGVSFIAKDAL